MGIPSPSYYTVSRNLLILNKRLPDPHLCNHNNPNSITDGKAFVAVGLLWALQPTMYYYKTGLTQVTFSMHIAQKCS